MKTTINYLRKTFGADDYNNIVNWVNAQYSRRGTQFGQSVSLADCNEFEAMSVVKNAVESLALSVDEVLFGISILPRINDSMSDFEVVCHINAWLFKNAFTRAGMQVDEVIFAREGDDVAYSGTNKHITYKSAGDNKNAPILCAFMNFSFPAHGVKGCVMLDKDEVEGVKDAAVEHMFNGLNILTENEWLDAAVALMFKRLLSESTFTTIHKVLSKDVLNSLASMVAYSEAFFSNKKSDESQGDSKVYNDYGRVIARKFFRFNIVDIKKHNNVTPIDSVKKENNTGSETTPESFDERTTPVEFGQF
jgi:hypothetical protein